MASQLPKNIANRVKKRGFELCDEQDYCARSRPDNANFITSLVQHPEIGGVVSQYTEPENVRTYIKDAILNAYSKQYRQKKMAGFPVLERLETMWGVSLIKRAENVYQSTDNPSRTIIVHSGTCQKWESVLRRSLDYIVANDHIQKLFPKPEICLVLLVLNDDMTQADRAHIEQAIAYIGARVIFVS